MSLKEELDTSLSALLPSFVAISHKISDNPEVGMLEFASAAYLADQAELVPGARVQRGIAGLDTAFLATAGDGDLVITFCAEYDALPGVGHGCGHNLIAATSFGAFATLAPHARELGITVQLIGTPGEENAGGKVMLLDAGAFDSTHVSLMIHPGPENFGSMQPLASTDIAVEFTGAGAHASYAPHLGRNALDALTVMLTSVGLARQQLEPGQQIHGVPVSDFGAANVIPERSTSSWMVRALDLDSMHRTVTTLERCARAGAIAADCELSFSVNPIAYSHLEADVDLLAAYQRSAAAAGVAGGDFEPAGGSTDMGNVSLACAAIHPMLRLGDTPPGIHTAEFAAAARGEAGDSYIPVAIRLLIDVAVEAAKNPALRARLTRGERRVSGEAAVAY